MINRYKITFAYDGFVANVLFNDSESEAEAIESAKLHNSDQYDSVRAELLVDSYHLGEESL